MNDYPNSTNIPNTWSTQGTTSSFNNYTLNTKWSQNPTNQSGNGTPTNPTLTTTFPSFSGGIPPLYPSISAQSSNSIQGGTNKDVISGGGVPSPFAPTNNTHPSHHAGSSTTHNHYGHGHSGGKIDKSISQSSSASSLTALTGGMTKLHINTSYNPYNAGFTPNEANTPNIPNSNGPTPTGFRFNNNNSIYANPYSNIQTPTTPLNATPINKWNTATTNALQQQAAMNNLNAMNMNMNYQLMNTQTLNPNTSTTTPQLSANSSFGALPNLSNPSSVNNHNKSMHDNIKESTIVTKLNSNAIPYQPSTTTHAQANANATATLKTISQVMKSQQLQHQQKADRVPYSYPSYAEAVNKDMAIPVPIVVKKDNIGTVVEKSVEQVETNAKMSSESEEAIQKLNPLTWPCNPRHSKFYVIKSFGEDDVHKSIKYNLWCSTERGNRKLDEAFNESKRINSQNNNNDNESNGDNNMSNKEVIDPRDTTRGCPVYLFFSVNRSGCFCGMAQMISNYYKDRHFGSWVQDGKWQGSFIVKWIYVKDIPNKDLKDITLPNNDNRPVTFSRDTQEIPFLQGIEMLRRFIKYEPKTNILQDFKYYDDRERDIKTKRTQQIILQQLQPNQNINPNQAQQLQQQVQSPQQTINQFNNNRKQGQIEGYSHSQSHSHSGGYNNNNNKYNNNRNRNNNNNMSNKHFQNNSYQQKRKYYSKNDRSNSNNRYNKYNNNNNRYSNSQQSNQESQYGNFQILSRKTHHNNNNNNNTSGHPNHNHNNQQTNDNTNIENDNDNQNRRYNNRNRNRWVPK